MFFVVVIVIALKFQGELAFSLEEKADRIACHPELWLLEGQETMDLPWKHLFSVCN